jgi:hypothetical protein
MGGCSRVTKNVCVVLDGSMSQNAKEKDLGLLYHANLIFLQPHLMPSVVGLSPSILRLL